MYIQTPVDYSFVAIGDIHLGWKLYNMPELQEDSRVLLERAVEFAISKKVTFFIVAGDMYDTQTPSEELVKFVTGLVVRLRAHKIIPIAISGDHDKRPGVDTTWVNDVNGFDTSLGPIHGVNYKNFLNVPGALATVQHPEDVHWIVLHGQEETLFPYIDEKKRLSLKHVDYSRFPNLIGILLGDIHSPIEGQIEIPELKRQIPVFYTGSLNVVRSNEIGDQKGVLYWDGQNLTRKHLEPTRTYAKFEFPQDEHMLPKFLEDIKDEKEKPLMVVVHQDDLTNEQKDSLKAFDGKVLLKCAKVRKGKVEEVVNIRSELRTDNKIEGVAGLLIEDESLRQLFVNLIQASDFKSLLDKYKEDILK